MILFSVGGSTFAIEAAAVDEIRNTDGLKAIRSTGCANVTHTLMRDAKTYCVVDAYAHFGIMRSRATRLLVLRDNCVAVLVDRIDRMTEVGALHALPLGFAGKERQWYRGLAVLGEGQLATVVPVVEPTAFLNRQQAESIVTELKKQ
jgi:chemotaxis signal transduction protein